MVSFLNIKVSFSFSLHENEKVGFHLITYKTLGYQIRDLLRWGKEKACASFKNTTGIYQ